MINWKGSGRKRLWLNFKELLRHSPGRTEKNHEKPQDSRSSGRDLNSGPTEYEAEVLNTQSRRSVQNFLLHLPLAGNTASVIASV
jgi:hypothetical protein